MTDTIGIQSPASDMNCDTESDTTELKEIFLNTSDIIETHPVHLMESKDVRIKMYKEAKARAINARKMAIEATMRAKNIKMEFMLDDEVDSDSEEYNSDDYDSDYIERTVE